MTNTSLKQVVAYIKQEIEPLYPPREAEAMIFHIMNHILNLSRTDLYLKPDTNVPKTALLKIEKITERLKKFEPLQYILGETSFYGLKILVNPKVLIPRPETEELAEWVLHENKCSISTIIDLGTGSGCIAIALASNRPDWEVLAADISHDALQLASRNALLNDTDIIFLEENMLNFSEKILNITYDLIISNPPYVTANQKTEMHANVLNYEPQNALFAPGTDPLIFYRAIASFAVSNLKKGGKVYAEINESLPAKTENIFKSAGFETILRKDIHGKYRMLKAYKND